MNSNTDIKSKLDKLKAGDMSCLENVQYFLANIEKKNKNLKTLNLQTKQYNQQYNESTLSKKGNQKSMCRIWHGAVMDINQI